jgi:hypothetical protein
MKIKGTIFAFLLIIPCVSYPVDIHTIDKNCNEMNFVAWDRYAQSLEGSAVTGTLTLVSIQDGSVNPFSGWKRWKRALIDLVSDYDHGYDLTFRNKDISLFVSELSEEHVINLKPKTNYEVRYTIDRVTRLVSPNLSSRLKPCVMIIAK